MNMTNEDRELSEHASSAYGDWLEHTGEFDTEAHESAFMAGFVYGMAWIESGDAGVPQ